MSVLDVLMRGGGGGGGLSQFSVYSMSAYVERGVTVYIYCLCTYVGWWWWWWSISILCLDYVYLCDLLYVYSKYTIPCRLYVYLRGGGGRLYLLYVCSRCTYV